MSCLRTAVVDIRPERKRFSISGSLLPLLLFLVLFVTQTSGRPSSENATTTLTTKHITKSLDATDVDDSNINDTTFDAGDEYTDVDNVEWHHVKVVDGIMHEDHPIIMYKEDFVSEDYDPNQHHANSNENGKHPRRRYKNIERQRRLNRTAIETEKYHALKPEKIYFDILPQAPVVVADDSSSNDSKFETAPIRVKVISLVDEETPLTATATDNKMDSLKDEVEVEEPTKELLNKHPKKYHRRTRRSAVSDNQSHTLHKRTPIYVYERVGMNSFNEYPKQLINNWGTKHAVSGFKWNGIDGVVPPAPEPIDFVDRFGGEDNTDRVVWGLSKAATRPLASNRPSSQFPPLFHNSNPNDADFSVFTRRPPINDVINDIFNVKTNQNNNNNNRRPTPTSQPPTTRGPQGNFPPLFHNSNPDDADFSVFTQRPPTTVRSPTQRLPTTTAPATRRQSSNSISTGGNVPISNCVWAIVSCCSSNDSNIRYDCFERLGCRGAFWNLNPCGDIVKDSVIDYVDQQFQ